MAQLDLGERDILGDIRSPHATERWCLFKTRLTLQRWSRHATKACAATNVAETARVLRRGRAANASNPTRDWASPICFDSNNRVDQDHAHQAWFYQEIDWYVPALHCYYLILEYFSVILFPPLHIRSHSPGILIAGDGAPITRHWGFLTLLARLVYFFPRTSFS